MSSATSDDFRIHASKTNDFRKPPPTYAKPLRKLSLSLRGFNDFRKHLSELPQTSADFRKSLKTPKPNRLHETTVQRSKPSNPQRKPTQKRIMFHGPHASSDPRDNAPPAQRLGRLHGLPVHRSQSSPEPHAVESCTRRPCIAPQASLAH